MLTIKKRGRGALAVVAAACLLLTGCAPPGVRALRKGDRLVQAGKYAEAIESLTQATNLLGKDAAQPQAKAHNLLGLAYHHTGNAAGARACYEMALTLDRNIAAEADYNLGCLELEQTNLNAARDALTTYTTLRDRDWNGFMKLGTVNYRLAMKAPANPDSARQVNFENARKAFDAARRIQATADAWNNLAMIDLVRRPAPTRATLSNAVAEFKAALACDTNYAPALLNLAVIYDPGGPYKYGDVQSAITAYRRYLALSPPPPHAGEVALLVTNLNTTMRMTIQRPGQPPEPATGFTSSTNKMSVTVRTNPPSRATTPPPAPPPAPAPVPAPAPATSTLAPVAALPASNPPPIAALPASRPPPIAALPDSRPETPPPPRPAATAFASNTAVLPARGGALPDMSNTAVARGGPATVTNVPLASIPVPKPSLWSRLFGSKPKPADQGPASAVAAYGNPMRLTPLPPPQGVVHYAAPPVSTIPGNRAEAERLFKEGAAAEKESRPKDAMAGYEQAVKADPAYYEACEALGMAAIKSEEYAVALEAFCHALALNPESANARYGYAWALQKKDYFQDAANELEKMLAQHPDETRAHLLLGNLYAQRLGQPDFARGHYQKVLEKDPRNDQAAALRAWLQNNPEP
jgi:tetratricopeptide (TPR) repeat protein